MKLHVEVYYNGGEIYKKEYSPDSGRAFSVTSCPATGVSGEYFEDASRVGELYNWYAVKQDQSGTRIKTYHATAQINRLSGRAGGESLDGFNLAPQVKLWLAVGRFKDVPTDTELYFRIDQPSALSAIAAHYGLQDPLSEPQKRDIEANPAQWRERNMRLGGEERVPVVVGSVAFSAGKPVRMKVYKFVKTS